MNLDEIEENTVALLKTVSSSSNIDVCKPPIPIEDIATHFFGFEIVLRLLFDKRTSGQIELAQKRIVVNSKEPIVRRRFSIAHEIGHWVLHTRTRNGKVAFISTTRQDRIEAEANAFAGAILMPKKLLYKYLLKNLSFVSNFETEWLSKILVLLPIYHYNVFNKLLFSQFFQIRDSSSKKKKEWAQTIVSLVPALTRDFRVSKEAISVRLQVLGLLNPIYVSNKNELLRGLP